MSDQHKEWEDDGRTVADMSGLDRSPLFGHKERSLPEEAAGAVRRRLRAALVPW